MNEALEKALTELLTKSTEGIDQAASFLSAEIPKVIQQLLMWHGVYNAILCFFGIVLFFILIYANYRQVKWVIKEEFYNEEEAPLLMVNILQAIPFAIICIEMINIQWLKIWIAPKAWLIDYAATLVSK